MEYVILWAVIGAIGGAIIGNFKGRLAEGAVVGGVLGIIGWLLLLFSPDFRRKCPSCKGAVPEDAIKCMHCGDPIVTTQQQPRLAPTDPAPVIEYWKEIVSCPACGTTNLVATEEMTKGIRCKNCNLGFVPKPAKSI